MLLTVFRLRLMRSLAHVSQYQFHLVMSQPMALTQRLLMIQERLPHRHLVSRRKHCHELIQRIRRAPEGQLLSVDAMI